MVTVPSRLFFCTVTVVFFTAVAVYGTVACPKEYRQFFFVFVGLFRLSMRCLLAVGLVRIRVHAKRMLEVRARAKRVSS